MGGIRAEAEASERDVCWNLYAPPVGIIQFPQPMAHLVKIRADITVDGEVISSMGKKGPEPEIWD